MSTGICRSNGRYLIRAPSSGRYFLWATWNKKTLIEIPPYYIDTLRCSRWTPYQPFVLLGEGNRPSDNTHHAMMVASITFLSSFCLNAHLCHWSLEKFESSWESIRHSAGQLKHDHEMFLHQWWPMSPTNLSFEKTQFVRCGRKIDRWGQIFVFKESFQLSVQRPIFSQFKRCFAIIWGKKHASA
jgi:hypothetical protein